MNSRALGIVKILLNSTEPVSSFVLSQELGCSAKTIQSEVKLINMELKSAKILSIRGVGYRLDGNIEDLEINNDLYEDINNRIYYLLRIMINLSAKRYNYIRIEDLADKMYVSTSTVKNDIKEIKDILANYDIKILTKPKQGIYIKREEDKLIKAILKICDSSKNELTISDFISEEVSNNRFELRNEILEILNTEKLVLSDAEYKSILNYIIIYISRNDAQKSFISTYIKEYKSRRNIVMNDNTSDNNIKSAIEEFCENLKLIASIDITSDNLFKEYLFNHIRNLYKKMILEVNQHYTDNNTIKVEYPYAFELAKIAKKTIERKLNIKIRESEISNIAVHVGGALQRASYKIDKKIYKIIIVCTSGIGTSMLLKSKLENIFKDRLEIVKIIPSYLVDYVNVVEFDFAISTVDVKIENKPVIKISPILNQNEIKMIEKYIETENIHTEIDIKTLFNRDIFFTELDLPSKEDAIIYMSNEAVKKGIIDSDMKESFLKREKLASTEIGNMVAIPHGSNGVVYKNQIAIGILKKPIKWEIGQVRLVIMLCIDNKKILNYEEIFFEIYKRVDSIAKVINICENKNYEKFINMFR